MRLPFIKSKPVTDIHENDTVTGYMNARLKLLSPETVSFSPLGAYVPGKTPITAYPELKFLADTSCSKESTHKNNQSWDPECDCGFKISKEIIPAYQNRQTLLLASNQVLAEVELFNGYVEYEKDWRDTKLYQPGPMLRGKTMKINRILVHGCQSCSDKNVAEVFANLGDGLIPVCAEHANLRNFDYYTFKEMEQLFTDPSIRMENPQVVSVYETEGLTRKEISSKRKKLSLPIAEAVFKKEFQNLALKSGETYVRTKNFFLTLLMV